MAVAWFSVKTKGFCRFLRSFRLKFDTFGDTVYQTFFLPVSGSCFPQNLDDQVDTVTSLDQTFLDLFFASSLLRSVRYFFCSQLKLEIHMVIDDDFRLKVSGFPPATASILTPKVSSRRSSYKAC